MRAALPGPPALRARHRHRPAAGRGSPRSPGEVHAHGTAVCAHGQRRAAAGRRDAGVLVPAAAQVAAPPRDGEPAESPFTAGLRAFPPASFTTVVDTFGLCSHADPVATLRARPAPGGPPRRARKGNERGQPRRCRACMCACVRSIRVLGEGYAMLQAALRR